MTEQNTPLRRMSGKRKDGSPVTVLMRDWGDIRPAFDANGNVFEAYQTEWWIDGDNRFTVLDRRLVEDAPKQLLQLRLTEDYALLYSYDIEAASLEEDNGKA